MARFRGGWERVTALVLTVAAGVLVMLRPAPSVDNLVRGYPATTILGATLVVGAVLNIVGLLRPSFVLQRVGLVLQITPLLLLILALAAVAGWNAAAYALLLAVLVLRLVGQYRRLATDRVIAAAIVTAVSAESQPDEP